MNSKGDSYVSYADYALAVLDEIENSTGNYFALSRENTDAIIYLAHIHRGSITVNQDALINECQRP